MELVELAGENRRLWLHDLGVSSALAFGAPKKLDKLLDRPRQTTDPQPEVHGMLKIPKKRK